jgi:hypothetical protein
MRRSIIVLLASGIAVAAAPAAGAKSTCSVPDKPAWHSCLTARHVLLANGNVKLKRATPSLVIRLGEPCPAHLTRRSVILRTKQGKRLAKAKVTGHCHDGIARYRVNMRPADVEVPPATVVRSYWSALADNKHAPKVKLG